MDGTACEEMCGQCLFTRLKEAEEEAEWHYGTAVNLEYELKRYETPFMRAVIREGRKALFRDGIKKGTRIEPTLGFETWCDLSTKTSSKAVKLLGGKQEFFKEFKPEFINLHRKLQRQMEQDG